MKHFYETIEGFCSYDALLAEAVAAASSPAVFVEIGVWQGRSTACLAVEIFNSGKSIEHYCVDPWIVDGRDTFAVFAANLGPLIGRVRPVRVPSPQAAGAFADRSVDFVLIDANHAYEAVMADIRAWLPKVKSGGVLAGDDCTAEFDGVRRAVAELLPAAEIRRAGESAHFWYRAP